MLHSETNQYVEDEVVEALQVQFGAESVERCDGDRQLFSVFFDATASKRGALRPGRGGILFVVNLRKIPV